MDKKAIRARIAQQRLRGVSKQEVFEELKGFAYSDTQLALLLASKADVDPVVANKGKIRLVVLVVLVQAILGFLVGWQVGRPYGLGVAILCSIAAYAIPGVILLGFIAHRLAAYNAFLVLTFIQCLMQLHDISQGNSAAWVGLGFASIMLTFVFNLRKRLFPEVRLFLPPKDETGKFVFV